ncbi:MAG: 7TM diverse intracellular signaling domain-containing protein [Ginsengibacter sp.]
MVSFANICNGQTIDASLTEKGYSFINKSIEYLASQKELSITEVLSSDAQKKFIKVAPESVIFKGYEPYHYWYRMSISNMDSVSKSVVLLLGQLGIRNSELWKVEKHKLSSLGKTGYEFPFHSRPYLFAHYAYPISIAPLSVDTFYVNVNESHAYKVMAFALLQPKVMKQKENRFYFLFGIFTGVLIFFAITNLYLYFFIKEKIHLWYSFYIITILFFMLKHEGLDSQFLGLDSFYGYRSTYMGAVAILAIGLLMHVVQKFLSNISPSGKLYKITSLVKVLCFVGVVIQWLTFLLMPDNTIEKIVFEVFNKINLVAVILIFINCIYSFYKGFKASLFILGGLSLFLVGAITRTLFLGSESYIFPPSLFEIGLVAEAIIISFGLMHHYKKFKKEKEQLLIKLETQSAEAAKQILITQQEEQQRIALDLHDELGGNLAAIKMRLQSFHLPESQTEIVNQLIDDASSRARNIAHNLMPPHFEETSLVELLNNYFQTLSHSGLCKFRFYSSDTSHSFDKQSELTIYRIFMELSNNIIKHSSATEATIQIIYYDEYLELMVEDNGTGFQNEQQNGLGLKNVHARVNYLKGTLNIDSEKSGTTIMIQIPYN